MVSKILTAALLGFCLCAYVSGDKQCDDITSKWWLPYGDIVGDDDGQLFHHRLYFTNTPFSAYDGHDPDGWKVSVRKGRSAGSIRVMPKKGFTHHGTFNVRASRLQYEPSSLGMVYTRMSRDEQDIDLVARIINEAYPCLSAGNFTPSAVFVATYLCMLHEGERDSFQAVIASDGHRTYVVVQYHMLHGQQSGEFGVLEQGTRNKFKFTGKRRDHYKELMLSTNGVREAVWVYDVTHTTPKTPELCAKQANECTVTDLGLVHSFDECQTVSPPDYSATLMSTKFDEDDDCSVTARAIMDIHGKVWYFDLWTGGHNATYENRRLIRINERPGIVQHTPPPGVYREELTDFPVDLGDINIKGAYQEGGWCIENNKCGYKFHYDPEGAEPQLRITLTNIMYNGRIGGFCGNKDLVRRNDEVFRSLYKE